MSAALLEPITATTQLDLLTARETILSVITQGMTMGDGCLPNLSVKTAGTHRNNLGEE
jgi:hypothetical protein